jgi:hypothetical protein
MIESELYFCAFFSAVFKRMIISAYLQLLTLN